MCSQVRKTKDTSIQETASAMQYGAIIELEEQALVMELATGTPMEIHYDLVAHDDALSEIQRSAKVQSDSIDAPDEAEEADGSKVEVLQRHAAGNAGGAMQTGKTLAALSLSTMSRQIEVDGGRQQAGFQDARKDEPQSLDARVQGARDLLARTKESQMAWASMQVGVGVHTPA
jgi:hypothetical protein